MSVVTLYYIFHGDAAIHRYFGQESLVTVVATL